MPTLSSFCYCSTESLTGHCDGKIWDKRKICISISVAFSRVPLRNFALSHKTFAFSRKKYTILEKLCILMQNDCAFETVLCFPENLCILSLKYHAVLWNICVPSQKYCIHPRNFAFSHKSIVFSCKSFRFSCKSIPFPWETLLFSQKYCSPKIFAFFRKNMAFSYKTFAISWETLSLLKKHWKVVFLPPNIIFLQAIEPFFFYYHVPLGAPYYSDIQVARIVEFP